MKKLGETDSVFYGLGLIGIGIALLCGCLYLLTGFSVLSIRYPCVFKSVTGLWCPGCGGIRSVKALLRGDLWQSFIDYPPTLYGVIVYAEFMVRNTIKLIFGKRHEWAAFAKVKDGAMIPFIYAGIIMMFLQWGVKLAAQIGFGVSWIR